MERLSTENQDGEIMFENYRNIFLAKAESLAETYRVTPEDVMMTYGLAAGKHIEKNLNKTEILERIYTGELEDDLLWDTTETILQKEAAEKLITIDSLTGLQNRDGLKNALKKLAERYHERGTKFSIILLDLDNFKAINDTYGHSAGDLVLKTVAGVIKEHTRENDVAFRYGGEEFGILVDDTESHATQMAERLRTVLSQIDPKIMGLDQPISGSFGVAEYKPIEEKRADSTTERLLKQVDDALYISKRNGRNRVTVYGAEA